MGEEDDTVDRGAANMRGPAGSGCERGRRVRERGRHAGPARGLRTCAPVQGGRGWAGWAAKPSSLGYEAFFLVSFFCFSFHLFCLNSNLVLEFEFQIGAPNLLELLSIS